MAPTNQPGPGLSDFSPLVVVKFREGTDIPYEEKAEQKATTKTVKTYWKRLNKRFPAATLKPLYPDHDPVHLRESFKELTTGNPDLSPASDPTLYFSVDVDTDQDARRMAKSIQKHPDVEYAYVMLGPAPPPFNPSDDPLARFQGYMAPAPIGISMSFAQTFQGGDGTGIQFIDIEQGWVLDHEDLAAAQIGLRWGINRAFPGHGTAVLGQVVAVDNDRGIIGIARNCMASVISQWKAERQLRTHEAIAEAMRILQPGDVMLLEAQVSIPDNTTNFLPVEIEPAVFDAIKRATAKGIIVIEAAGNGSNNLDTFQDVRGRQILNRKSADFADSGAIMVGAGSSSIPHQRLGFSNFGSRIDCFAWGENIVTTGDGDSSTSKIIYTNTFGGTSGASPIIAGTAIIVQAIRLARNNTRFSALQMRTLLSNAATSTTSANPATDLIGVMPDLKKLIPTVLQGIA